MTAPDAGAQIDPGHLRAIAIAPPARRAHTIDPPPVSGGAIPALDRARILVVRADRLGDVVLSLPVLGELRARYPGAELALLTSASVAPVLRSHPWIDRLLVDEPEGRHRGARGFGRLVQLVRAARFDLALVLRPTPRHATLPWASRVPVRVGTAFRAYSWFFNRRVKLHRRGSGRHELELNLALLAALVGPIEPRAPLLTVEPAARRTARRLLAGETPADATAPLVVLHPGTGGSARDWPAAAFAELGERLRGEGLRVAITGAATETALAAQVAVADPAVINLAGATSLPVLAAVLAEAAVLVAGSTGPLHVAAALGTPVVAAFPPMRDALPDRWGPWSACGVVLQPDVPICPRCVYERCPYWDCMRAVTPERVAAAVSEQLAAASGPGSADRIDPSDAPGSTGECQ